MKGTMKQIILGQARQSYTLPWRVVPQASSSNVSQAPNIVLDFFPREQRGAECVDFIHPNTLGSNTRQQTRARVDRFGTSFRESQGPDQVLNGHPAGPETSSETSRRVWVSLKELARPQARDLGNSGADKLGTGQAH